VSEDEAIIRIVRVGKLAADWLAGGDVGHAMQADIQVDNGNYRPASRALRLAVANCGVGHLA
jgi:hypothetical protein